MLFSLGSLEFWRHEVSEKNAGLILSVEAVLGSLGLRNSRAPAFKASWLKILSLGLCWFVQRCCKALKTVCMHVCIHIHTYVCVCICIYTHNYVYIHIDVHMYEYTY